MVVGRDPVRGDEQQVLVVDPVQLTNLAAGQVLVVGQSGAHSASLTAPVCCDRTHEIAVGPLRHNARSADVAAVQRRRDDHLDDDLGDHCATWKTI